MMFQKNCVLAIGAAAAGCLSFTAAHAGTITSGNASFNMLAPAFGTNNGDSAFITDTGGTDQCFKYTWYYRTPNNNTNRFMSSLDTPVESYAGDTATFTFTNAGPGVAGAERFDATIQTKLSDAATANKSRVVGTCQFKNHANTTITYQVFVLVDLDLAGGGANPGTDDSITLDTVTSNALQTESSSANFANIQAVAPTRWQVGTGSALRTLLGSGAGNLTNAVGPVNGDGAVAFQWTLTLAPGEQTTLTVGFAINDAALCVAPTFSQNPANAFTCPSATASFSASADANPTPGYQWQWRRPGQAVWNNVVAGSNTDGVATFGSGGGTSTIFNVTGYQELPATPSVKHIEVQALASNACGNLPSTAAVLTICVADFDCSGGLAIEDIFAFLNAWFAGAASADVNGGGLAVSDIFDFLNAWFAGC
jgi:hypothetical protein